MLFAKRVFLFAGIWGLLVIVPGFFNEPFVAQTQPPPITHPEYFYGFYTTALAFQVLFLLMARDPVRYRALMPACMLEKFGFVIAAAVLWGLGRIPQLIVFFAFTDLVWGALFVLAYRKTPKQPA
ncbi:MAG TPA: hypothetical protein VLA96_01995 [Terriglobales bacterium]|nr:hypothetical protein [Terriglobales bacterium]